MAISNQSLCCKIAFMVSESPVSYIQCPSCLRRNHSEMHFCIYCGAGVTPEAERKRTANPLSWRTCIRCGQTDELNQNFCIFCSGKIVVPGNEKPDSSAFRKFSWELEQIDAEKVVAKAEPAPRRAQPPVVARPKKKSKGGAKTLVLTAFLALLGVGTGAAFAFIMGQVGLQRLVLQSTTWNGKALVVYTNVPYSNIMIAKGDRQTYFMTKTDAEGTLCLGQLKPGEYKLYASAPGRVTISQSFPVQSGRTTVLGFPVHLEIPTPEQAAKKRQQGG